LTDCFFPLFCCESSFLYINQRMSEPMDISIDAKLLAEGLNVPEERASDYLAGKITPQVFVEAVDGSVLTHAHVSDLCSKKVLSEPLLVALINKSPENIVPEIAKILRERKDVVGLEKLLKDCREDEQFRTIARAKATKCVRSVLDEMSQIEGTEELVTKNTKECIEWAIENHQTLLRQRLQIRLSGLYLAARQLETAAAEISKLLTELRKLDDKPLLVEALLIDSAIHRAMNNLPKAKAALTGARTNAGAIYCSQKLQGELDLQSGIVNADERDYVTAYSYFYEAAEGFLASNDSRALQAFTYMLLSKIMSSSYSDIPVLLSAKNAQTFVGSRPVAAMQALCKACKERALHAFLDARETYKDVLSDFFITSHLEFRQNALLEENLQRIIEPFSCVEIAHVAELIDLPLDVVEKRLSQMILDKKIDGILDQGAGSLITFDRPPQQDTNRYIMETIIGLNNVVDRLYSKAVNIA